MTSTSCVCLPLYNVSLIVFLNCKSLGIKVSAKWINVNVEDKKRWRTLLKIKCFKRLSSDAIEEHFWFHKEPFSQRFFKEHLSYLFIKFLLWNSKILQMLKVLYGIVPLIFKSEIERSEPSERQDVKRWDKKQQKRGDKDRTWDKKQDVKKGSKKMRPVDNR